MSQVKIDALGLIELLESSLSQITALANVAHYTLTNSNKEYFTYINDVANLLVAIKNISTQSDLYRNELSKLIKSTS